MVDPIGGSPFESIEKIKREIKEIQGLNEKVQRQTRKHIQDSLPNFSEIFQQKKQSSNINEVIQQEANKRGLDPDLIRSVIQTESNFQPDAVSEKGAIGLMQLMPDTAAELNVNPEDPRENIKGGTEYLARQLDEFGNLEEALAAYNAGPGAVKDHGGIPPYSETQNYVKQVVGTFRNLKGSQGSAGQGLTESPF